MTPLSSSHVDEVIRRYHGTTLLHRSKSLLKLPHRDLRRVRRQQHSPNTEDSRLTDAEDVAARNNVDSLLQLVSVLEVLAVATGETPPLSASIRDGLAAFLNEPLVSHYYEKQFPLALP